MVTYTDLIINGMVNISNKKHVGKKVKKVSPVGKNVTRKVKSPTSVVMKLESISI